MARLLYYLWLKGRVLNEEDVEFVIDVVCDRRLVVELKVLEEVVAIDQGFTTRPALRKTKLNY